MAESEKYPEFDRKIVAILEKWPPFWKNYRHFKNGGHVELENVKFGFLDLVNPRKVLLHKIIGSEKKEICLNIPNMIFKVAAILKNGRHFEIVKIFMGTPSKLIS